MPRAAAVLRDDGVGEGDRVILWAVNRPEWGIGLLACAHLGAVAVPLDVRHPVEFGRKIVDQTGAKLVLACRQTDASARALGLPVLWVETLVDEARRADAGAGGRRDPGHARRDRVHERHDGRAEGRHADPRQPRDGPPSP